jgi:large subunit ribosomal protein L23
MTPVIKKPLITEKATKLGTQRQYVFEVYPGANIEEMFEVDVVSVRTVNVKGKLKSRFTKRGLMRGRTPNRKKAYLTIKEGQTIDVVTGTTE